MNASKHVTVCQRIGPHTLTQKVSSIDIDKLAHLLSTLMQTGRCITHAIHKLQLFCAESR